MTCSISYLSSSYFQVIFLFFLWFLQIGKVEILSGFLEYSSERITSGFFHKKAKSFKSPLAFLIDPAVDKIVKIDERKLEENTAKVTKYPLG